MKIPSAKFSTLARRSGVLVCFKLPTRPPRPGTLLLLPSNKAPLPAKTGEWGHLPAQRTVKSITRRADW